MCAVGLMKANGDLNWNCPCLGGMATGPCGVEFREAFSCFHYSEADPKGSDCLEPFKTMSGCMAQYPGVYGSGEDNPMAIDEDNDDETLSTGGSNKSSSVSKSNEEESADETRVQAPSKTMAKS